MRQRVARSRELVAVGFKPAVVARVAGISRQALYRRPTPRRAPQRRPPAGPVERVIVEEALAHPTDGYRMVCAWARRRLKRPVNRKRVLRVMREQRLIQRRRWLDRRRRPGFFCVEARTSSADARRCASPRRLPRSPSLRRSSSRPSASSRNDWCGGPSSRASTKPGASSPAASTTTTTTRTAGSTTRRRPKWPRPGRRTHPADPRGLERQRRRGAGQ